MHYVLIVGSYYPDYSAVGKCMGNIATELARLNKVTVVCEKTTLLQKNREIYNDQNLIRVSTPFRMRAMNTLNQCRSNRKKYILNKQIIRIQRFFRKIVCRTSVDKQLVEAYKIALNSIEEEIDVIIPTCSPFDSVVAALDFKKIHDNIRVCPYLFDLFADNNNLNLNCLNKKLKYKENLLLEKDMFERSQFVFYVENWGKHIESCFASFFDKCKYTEHPLLLLPNDLCRQSSIEREIYVECIGMESLRDYDIASSLEIIKKIQDPRIYFNFIDFEFNARIIEKFLGTIEQIQLWGKIDGESYEKKQNEPHIYIIFNNIDNLDIIPVLIKYALERKPIILFTKNKDTQIVNILEKYSVIKIIDLGEEINYSDLRTFILDCGNKVISFTECVKIIKELDSRRFYKEINNVICDTCLDIKSKRLLFTGSLRKGYVEPDYILRLFSSPNLSNDRVIFYSAGNDVGKIDKCDLNNIIAKEWIPRPELEGELKRADALISIAEKSGEQISSKIFDYMSFKKPIIHIYYHDNDVNVKYLKNYSDSLCIRADDDVEENSKWVKLFLHANKYKYCQPKLDNTLYECTPEYICKEIVRWITNN